LIVADERLAERLIDQETAKARTFDQPVDRHRDALFDLEVTDATVFAQRDALGIGDDVSDAARLRHAREFSAINVASN
jgi:hypothetical protein